MRLKLDFRGPNGTFTEFVSATQAGRFVDRWALESHASFAPLAPGDRVITEGDRIVDVYALKPQRVFEVAFHLPAGVSFGQTVRPDHPAVVQINTFLANLMDMRMEVTRTTAWTCLVSGDGVPISKIVEHTQQIRNERTVVDIDWCLAHPAIA